ncbi:MAG: hypothetical protein FJ041_03225 [Candidatus Cloacimonetes bacterium]|nr:hypothetical protein [Candidatus Cloacimonadota bacterium]
MKYVVSVLLVTLLLLVCLSCSDRNHDNDNEYYLKGKITDTGGNLLTDAKIYIVFDDITGGKGINDSLGELPLNFFRVYPYQEQQLDWNDVKAFWYTYTESNMLGFYVLRATCNNLDSAAVISPLIPANNTQQYTEYYYIDRDLPDGIYYYWLKAEELDNTCYYYGPVYLSVHQYQPPVNWSFYACPNPFSAYTFFCFKTLDTCNIKIDISSPYLGLVKTLEQEVPFAWGGMHKWNGIGGSNYPFNVCNGLYQAKLTATDSLGTLLWTHTINFLKNRPDSEFYNAYVTLSASSGYSIPYKKYFQFGKQLNAYDEYTWEYDGTFSMPSGFTIYVEKNGYTTVSRHINITDYKADKTEDFILQPVSRK